MNKWIDVNIQLPPYDESVLLAGIKHDFSESKGNISNEFVSSGHREITNKNGEIYCIYNYSNRGISHKQNKDYCLETEVKFWQKYPDKPQLIKESK